MYDAIITIVSIMFLLCCCGISEKENDTLVSAWETLHNSNIAYVQNISSVDEKGNTTNLVFEGEYTAKPRIFTQKVVEGESLWSEAYYYKKDKEYKGVLEVDGNWQEALVA